MRDQEKIYFGHPITIYNTVLEQRLIACIALAFPEHSLENPNQAHHQEGYRRWKEKTGKSMDYFFNEVLPRMSAGVFLPFEDGKWGTGVFREATFLKEQGKSIYEINLEGTITQMRLDDTRALSIEETCARISRTTGS